MPPDDSVPITRELAIPRLALALVLLAIPTLLGNRALLPSLLGARTGLEHVLEWASFAFSISSQLLAMGLALLIVKLTVYGLGAFAHGATGRLMVLPIGSAVAFLLIASSVGPLDAEMHLLLAALGTTALLCCSAPTLRHPSLRAAGLLLVLAACASLTYSLGRVLALKASIEALPREYAVSRVLVSCGQLFDFLALLWVSAWLALSKPHARGVFSDAGATTSTEERSIAAARVTLAIAISVAFALLGTQAQSSTSTLAEVVLSRSISALAREPRPLGTQWLSPTLDILSVVYALILVTRPRHIPNVCRLAVALVLLGRSAPDIPAHAALMTAGALLLLWFAPSPVTNAASAEKSEASAVDAEPLPGQDQGTAMPVPLDGRPMRLPTFHIPRPAQKPPPREPGP